MIEKKRGEQTAEARVAEALSKALAEDLGDIPKVSITVEELKALEREDRRKRTKRRLRYFSMAAAAVVICVVALYAFWPETAVPVSADKNTEQSVEAGNDVVVINEGDVEGEAGTTVIEASNWENVEKIRETMPQLAIPYYIPEGYEIETLHIEKYTDLEFMAKYIFKNKKQYLRVTQRYYKGNGTKATEVGGYTEKVKVNDETVYLSQEKGGTIMATQYLKEGTLVVIGTASKDILVKVISEIHIESPH